jgi:phosphohistidine phosphatase
MILYLLRHGKADHPGWTAPDDDRPLTAEGIQEMRHVAAALKRLKVAPALILTSPLPRALKTAQITAEILGQPLDQSQALRPGFDRPAFDSLLATHKPSDLMLVGHDPDFTLLIRSLTGARVKLPKAATAAIDLDPAPPRLLGLFPAKALLRLS